MLAKVPYTPAEIAAAVEEMADELSLLPEAPPAPPTPRTPNATSVPPVPPIEEVERQPRRRKTSNLRYLDQRITEDGLDGIERIGVARPGYRIIGIRQQAFVGRPSRFVVLTQRQRVRRRKANGKTNGGSDA
jgi:hypothetical protein